MQLHNLDTTRRAQWWVRNSGTEKSLLTPEYDGGDASLAFFPPAGQWAHVAATATAASPSTFTLYRDGATQSGWTKSDGVAPNPTAMAYTYAALGRDDLGTGASYFDGALRDVRLYARALGADEVATLAATAAAILRA